MASTSPNPGKFRVRTANESDLPAILSIVNEAFTVERFFLAQERTNPQHLGELFQKGAFLLAEDSADVLVASVYVEPRGERAYFGMLAVLPNMQGHGLGRLLVEAAENWARERGCEVMDLTVVNLRTELPPFYGKLGYVESGTAPLHEHMNVTQPAHLIRMSKQL